MNRKSNYFILTGTPGTGKTTLLELLRAQGQNCVSEVAREVLAQQLAVDGPGLPSKSPLRFIQMMLQRSTENFRKAEAFDGPVFFDRGIPDLIAYAIRFEVSAEEFETAAKQYGYNKNVFVFSPWKEIFVNDNERKITFEGSLLFHQTLQENYQKHGYKIIEVPFTTPERRAKFILEKITEL